jgi:endonuclease III
MKRGSEYAAKVKRLFNKLKREYGKPAPVDPTDPVEQIIISILTRDTSDSRAQKALANLRTVTVDLNDLRVTTVPDIVDCIGGDYPDGLQRAKDMRAALQNIFNRESILILDFLRDRTRRDARQYLESLDGVDAFTAASVVLWSLGGHAIPVDGQMVEMLIREDLVAPKSQRPTIQAFLEHHISASDAHTFSVLFRRYAVAHAPRTMASTGSNKSTGSSKSTGDNKRKVVPMRKTQPPAKKKAEATVPKRASTTMKQRKSASATTRAKSRSVAKRPKRKTAKR